MKARRYSVVLADRATGAVRRFTIPLRPVLTAVVCVVTLPVLIGLGARWSADARISQLRAENALLQIENASFRGATGELAGQIASLQTAMDEIGVKAAVDPDADRAMNRLPARVRSRAMGGGSEVGSIVSDAVGAPDSPFGVLRGLLGAIENRLDNVRTGVERRHALASATPSIWPLTGWISSGFGSRRDPFTGGTDFHPGLDISGNTGQEIQAPADGMVIDAAYSGNYGNLVTLDHGFGITTRYAHLSRFAISPGQQVHRGQVIGYVGTTGRSTSSHLHYEVLVNGQLTNPLNLLSGR
ncbi:MAG: M23 family metallopeptidase [Acidobacteriota bacterium]|nr:M23 family metallopeptidase [Acidobacteriota bacterium]